MKDSDALKKSLPILQGSHNYRTWKDAVLGYLELKHLRHYLQYFVQDPVDATAETSSSPEFQDVKVKLSPLLPPDKQNLIDNLPFDVKCTLQALKNPSFTVWWKRKPGVPDIFKKLLQSAYIIIIVDNMLFPCYDLETKFENAETEQIEQKATIKSLFRLTIHSTILHLFESGKGCVKTSFDILTGHFEKNSRMEQDGIVAKMGSLHCSNLLSYIEKFKQLLAQFDNVQGDRYSPSLLPIFLKNISDAKFHAEKRKAYQKFTNVDDSIEFFKNIANAEDSLQTHSTGSSSSKKEEKSSDLSVVAVQQLSSNNKVYSKRCYKCSGRGHSVSACGNKVPVCFYCGDPNHAIKQCPCRQKKAQQRATKIAQVYAEEAFSSDESVTDNVEPKLDETSDDIGIVPVRQVFTGSVVSPALHHSSCKCLCTGTSLTSTSVDEKQCNDCTVKTPEEYCPVIIGRTSVFQSTTIQKCSSRFRDKCLCLLLDSGANRHIVGDRKVLKNIRHITPLPVTNAFGKTSTAGEEVTLM